MADQRSFDVAIIGAGPVGCVAALAFARQGRQVLLLEANPRTSDRFAGEWLHPPAVRILKELGVEPKPDSAYPSGQGFAVFPDDGSGPIVLPYRSPGFGMSIEHHKIVDALRSRCHEEGNLHFWTNARATRIDGQNLTCQVSGANRIVHSDLIVGAAGKNKVTDAALGIERESTSYSRMAGVLLEDVEVPFEGYGHVFLGGPGPVLAYRVAGNQVRMCIDVPLTMPVNQGREATLWEGFAPVLPEGLRPGFQRALEAGRLSWAANKIRPRVEFGREGLALVGDAVGHHHPLTALGMTLGFQDAMALANAKSFAAFRRERIRGSRVPEMLAVALYEVFADGSDESVSIRRAVYDMWRRSPDERLRTMGLLAGDDSRAMSFARSFLVALGTCSASLVGTGVRTGEWRHVVDVVGQLGDRVRWLVSGALFLSHAEPTRPLAATAEARYGALLKAQRAQAEVMEHPSKLAMAARRHAQTVGPDQALARGVQALLTHQAEDGSWEGEVVWCPLLAAQYVLACHIVGREIAPDRRARILRHFERTRLADGAWGLHELSEPYLFVTTLVYVAARLLGVDRDDPLIRRGRTFIEREGGVAEIPSWGKFWLSMLGLYDWSGVHPVLPELWKLPEWMPMHPSKYYCHTRNIYMGMACIFASRFSVHHTSLIRSLRGELYPNGYDQVDFSKLKGRLRSAEIFTPPSPGLKLAYKVLAGIDKVPRQRTDSLETLREHIRYELRATAHTSISPVSGMLNIIALWLADPNDPDVAEAWNSFEGWIWEDDVDGLRVAGARSATWDTSFAAQALAEAAPHEPDAAQALRKADRFLASQQIVQGTGQEAQYYRLDPSGGYCFAGVWHGWPVSDCTAEALVARLVSPVTAPSAEAAQTAMQFILRCKNDDGGFGSYEARRGPKPLEWVNPAEMFGDSMVEHSYVECTSSCVAALSEYRHAYPGTKRGAIDRAIKEGARQIRLQQRHDGSWAGNWGVHFIYGTMFGVRGLLAAGAPPQDADIRRACTWLLEQQNPDGGWGERYEGRGVKFVPNVSHSVQTAWALMTLLEAQDPSWEALDRAARFLATRQRPNGEWPKEEPVGIFFHTALLDYVLYRSYFPVWALAAYETRRKSREAIIAKAS